MNKYSILISLVAIIAVVVIGYNYHQKENELKSTTHSIRQLEGLIDVYHYALTNPGDELDSVSNSILTDLPSELVNHSNHIKSFIKRLMTEGDTTDFQTLFLQQKTSLERVNRDFTELEEKNIKLERQIESIVDSFQIREKRLEDSIKDKEKLVQKRSTTLDSLTAQIKQLEKGKKDLLKFKSPSGTPITYFGEISNGKAHGFGIGLYSSGSKYEGDWKYGYKHGEGTYEYPDGERYIGNFEADKRNGMGKYYWPNGDIYHGYWQADKRHGEGVIKDKSGKIVSTGIWKNDVLEKSVDINF